MLNPITWAWLAGIVEGEGHISAHKRNDRGYSFVLEVNMGDHDIIKRLKEQSGVGNIYGPYKHRGQKVHHKEMMKWVVRRKEDLQFVLQIILPLMGERKSLAIKDVLSKLKTIKGRRNRCL